MNISWWDRWEDRMNFVPRSAEPRATSVVAGTIATLAVLALFGGVLHVTQLDVGRFIDGHSRSIATAILLTLLSLAAMASTEGSTAAP